MNEKISQELEKLESEQGIKILYACESGSRAWGFPSKDSDYDVRFIYAQSSPRYLSIYDRKEAIDLFLAEELDLIGWDIRKALRLFHKSNASLFEWMQSPIVYREHSGFIQKLRELAPEYFSPRTAIHHYLGMARHTFLGHLQGSSVKIKKYFYTLRPLLCAKWILTHKTYPPIAFQKLLEMMKDDSEFMGYMDELLQLRESSSELQEIAPIPYFQGFIEEEMLKDQAAEASFPRKFPDAEKLNRLFQEVL